MNDYDDDTDACTGSDCQTCGDDLLVEGTVYYDGQEIVCPSCKTVHLVCMEHDMDMHLYRADSE